ncbi:hypothetical protein Tco_1116925 [Tanacetum coccineum]
MRKGGEVGGWRERGDGKKIEERRRHNSRQEEPYGRFGELTASGNPNDEEESDSDDEIRDEGLHDESVDKHKYATVEGESDVEEVPETIFENEQYQAHKKDDLIVGHNDIRSEDPFNIYDLLNKKQDNINGGDKCLQNIHDEKVASKVKKTCPLSNPNDDREESICSAVIMGDFNKVRKQAERYGSQFNVQGADAFNSFISVAGLEEVSLGG